MKLGKVLFPTDYSRTGDLAFSLAASVASHTGAKLLIVHVQEASGEYGGEHYHGVEEPSTDDLKRQLQRLVPKDSRVQCRRHVLTGKPAEAITQFARDNQVELIVMGTHGCTGIASVLVGSVAEEIIGSASCPVLAVKTVREKEMYEPVPKADKSPPLRHKQLLQTLGGLVKVCVDSARGLREAADDVKHGGLKILLSDRSEQRRDFAEELQSEAALRGAVPERRGSLLGKVFRQWIFLNKALGDDGSVLTACLKEEQRTFSEYRNALQLGLPDDVRKLLERHLAEIRLLDRALIGIKESGVLEINVTE